MNTATIGEIRVRCDGGNALLLVPGSELGAGGQAVVYPVPGRADQVAKVYHHPTPEQQLKLRQMLARRPAGASPAGAGAGIFAWPQELLLDEEGRFAGVLLPRVDGKVRVFELYNPATRRERAPLFHHGLLHRAARNLAAAFDRLHEAGYVVGDVNESNILVGDDGRVVLIDTDSFQVSDPSSGAVFRCPVGRPEFTPPELRERSFADVDRAPQHDRFGLGVLVFQMLMEGTHPFAGRFRGQGEPPSIQERIAGGLFPYGLRAGGVLEPPRTAPPLQLLAPGVWDLVRRCFEDGHHDPAARPSAAEWRDALAAAEESLATCPRNEQHRHAPHLGACPWCERARRLEGRDPFPSANAVRRGEHRPRPVPARAPLRAETAASPRPRPRPVANRAKWSLPVSALDALLGTAIVLIPLVAIIAGVPLLPVLLVSAGLWAAARHVGLPGRLTQWVAGIAVVLVLCVLAGRGTPTVGAREIFAPAASRGAPIPAVPYALGGWAVDRRPVPRNVDSVAAVLAAVRSGLAKGADRWSVVELVVDQDGRVDPATLTMDPAADVPLLAPLRPAVLALRFQPAERAARPVRAQVRFMVHWKDGGVEPSFQLASWVPESRYMATVGRPGWMEPPYQTAPVLEDAEGVEALLDRTVPPEYRRAGFVARATVRFRVDAAGAVEPGSIVVVDVSDDAFAEPAATVAARMRYRPAMLDGEAVPAYVTEKLSWELYR